MDLTGDSAIHFSTLFHSLAQMNTFITSSTTIRPNAYHLGHARNQSKRYGQVLETDAEFLAALPTPGPSTPPPLSPSPSLTSSDRSSPSLSSGIQTPGAFADEDFDTASISSFPAYIRGNALPPQVLIHAADADEGATLDEVRALGAFWRSLGGDDDDGLSLLAADAPGDKYRSLLAALDTPPPATPTADLSDMEDESFELSTAADELIAPEWETSMSFTDVAANSGSQDDSLDTTTGSDVIGRILDDLEAEVSTMGTGGLAELSALEPSVTCASIAPSSLSPLRSHRRRASAGRSATPQEFSFSAWVEVGQLPGEPSHRGSVKLVKDQQTYAKGHRRRPSAAMSVPDLKIRAKAMGVIKKTSMLFSPFEHTPQEADEDEEAAASAVSHRRTSSQAISKPQLATSAELPEETPVLLLESNDLDSSLALDRLEMSLAKLDQSIHLEPPSPTKRSISPLTFASRPTSPLQSMFDASRNTAATVPARRYVRTKPSLPAIPWELYDPKAPRPLASPTSLLTVPQCSPLTMSASAPSAIGFLSLVDDDPFAMPLPSPTTTSPLSGHFPRSPSSPLATLPVPGPSAATAGATRRAHTPAPKSMDFVMLPHMPPLWTIDELAPHSSRKLSHHRGVSEDNREKEGNGLLKKAVRKAGMVGWWGKQKAEA
jgi:hypothetical protein